MTEREQIRALAELDGYTLSCNERTLLQWNLYKDGVVKVYLGDTNYGEGFTWESIIRHLPDYLTSYDAILPLIQKQRENSWSELFQELCNIVEPCECGQHWSAWAFDFTPAQLCEALLRATGKWKD